MRAQRTQEGRSARAPPLIAKPAHTIAPISDGLAPAVIYRHVRFNPREMQVFVLNDGGEADFDLGNYERFLDINLRSDRQSACCTSSRVPRSWVITRHPAPGAFGCERGPDAHVTGVSPVQVQM